jgi:hypothetical protein
MAASNYIRSFSTLLLGGAGHRGVRYSVRPSTGLNPSTSRTHSHLHIRLDRQSLSRHSSSLAKTHTTC